MTLDRSIRLSPSIANYIILKFSNGSVHKSALTNTGADLKSNAMRLAAAIPDADYDVQLDPTEVIWVVYSSADQDYAKLKVIGLAPSDDNTISVTLEDYNSLYETAKDPAGPGIRVPRAGIRKAENTGRGHRLLRRKHRKQESGHGDRGAGRGHLVYWMYRRAVYWVW